MSSDHKWPGKATGPRFTKIFGELGLKSHLGFEMDFMKTELYEKFEESGGHARLCPTIVGQSAAWTIELLWDEMHKDPDLENIPDLKEAADILASFRSNKG